MESTKSNAPPLKLAFSPEPGRAILDTPDMASSTVFQFLGQNERVLPVDYKSKNEVDRLQLTFDKEIEVPLIREVLNDKVVAHHLVHYRKVLDEHARTGVQRRFRASLASLDADSPELTTLFRCVEQVILDPGSHSRQSPRAAAARESETNKEAPATLQVDINSIANASRRKRMSDGTDLGYILDLLIKSLSQATSDSYRSTDAMGRDEEEQVGADDDIDVDESDDRRTVEQAGKILALCHQKIGQLVRRTQSELERTTKDKLPIDEVTLKHPILNVRFRLRIQPVNATLYLGCMSRSAC